MRRDESGRRPLWCFVHLQKTAGTALTRRLRRSLGNAAVYPAAGDGDPVLAVLDPRHMLAAVLARRAEVRVVCGHFPLSVTDLFDEPVRVFTLLRHPVPRTLSFLRHQRSTDPAWRDAALSSIYDDPALHRGLIRNHMTKMLVVPAEVARTTGPLADIDLTTPDVERALRRLGRVDVVGVQEDFDGFVRRLEAATGWDLGPPLVANRSPAVPEHEPDLRDLRQRIAEDNALDVCLYERAVAEIVPSSTEEG